MEVYVYQGEWGLASIDLECLRTLMYIRITKAPVQIRTGTSTFWSPNGTFPYLVAEEGKVKVAGYRDIVAYLVTLNHVIPTGDGFEDSYIAVLRQDLLPYFLYTQWCTASKDESRALYANRISFPYSFITPKQYGRKADRLISSRYGFSLEDSAVKQDYAEMAFKAKQVLNELEEKLKATDFATGHQPSELDVHVYAFAALIHHNKLPNNSLQTHLQQCPNLVRYVQRVTKKYFEKDGFCSDAMKAQKKKQEKKVYTGQEDEDDPREKRKRYIVSTIVATVTMVSYALIKGILNLPYDNNNESYIDYVLDNEDGGGGDDEEE